MAEIDLDWSDWNAAHKGQKRSPAAQRGHKAVKTGVVSKREIRNFKKSAGLKGKNAAIGGKASAALEARANMPGHFRAKAILAASKGDVKSAKMYQAKRAARLAKQRKSKPGAPAPTKSAAPAVPPANPTRHRRPPRNRRLQAKVIRAHAVAQRKNRDLSTELPDFTDLAFRYKHGWIKIGPEVGAENAAPKIKMDWKTGHQRGWSDAAEGKRPSVSPDSMYGVGYQRGYAEYTLKFGAAPSDDHNLKVPPQARDNVIAARRRLESSARRVSDPVYDDKIPETPLLDTVRQGTGPEKGAKRLVPGPAKTVPKKKSKLKAKALDVLARLKADEPVIGTWLSNEVGGTLVLGE